MVKRTVEISREPTHLTVRDRQLLLLRKDGPPKAIPANPPNLAASIPTEDIGLVIVDQAQSSYSHAALVDLIDRGAVLVICGDNHLPVGMLLPLAEHTEVVWRLKDQIEAPRPLRKQLWKSIVQAKITRQAENLSNLGIHADHAAETLTDMARRVRSGDVENHEAQAAKVYWHAWLGDRAEAAEFRRDATPGTHAPPPNNFLNYGYAVARAATARALVSAGLLPALGIKHRNRSNAFCLADDLMEPLRPLVDRIARTLFLAGENQLTQPNKATLLHVLAAPVTTPDRRTGADPRTGALMVALHRYCASFADSLSSGQDCLEIPYPRYETL